MSGSQEACSIIDEMYSCRISWAIACPLRLIGLWIKCSIVIVFVSFGNLLQIRLFRPHLASFHVVDHVLACFIHYLGCSRGCYSGRWAMRLHTLQIVWLVFKHFTCANSSTFISKCESTHLLNHIEFLKWDTSLYLNTADNFALAPNKLRLELLNDISAVVLLPTFDDILNDDLILPGVDMHHAAVSLGHNGLVLD